MILHKIAKNSEVDKQAKYALVQPLQGMKGDLL